MQRTQSSRREFVKRSMLAGAAVAGGLSLARSVHAAGSDVIKFALIGCGGRGTGAAANCMNVQRLIKQGIRLVAVADAFEDRAKGSLAQLRREYADQIDVPPERIFVGLDAYQKAIDCGVDLVVMAAPPGFRPEHYAYAIQKGKHVFMEKPCCVDGRGYQMLMEANKLADEKGLLVGVGLQRRHEPRYIETVKRLQDGAIGKILLLRVYWNGGGIWNRPREPGMTEMQYQVHNWYHFCWLSGDHICEQHVHNLDIANWVMSAALKKEGENWAHPVKANGMGALWHRGYGDFIKVVRGGNKGQIYDAHFVEFTYENGVTMLSQCRHQPNCWNAVTEFFHSTKSPSGGSNLGGRNVAGAGPGPKLQHGNPYVQEHIALLLAIKEGKPLNEAYYGAVSSMTAVLGRMATYSGVEVKWDDAVKSGPDSFPANLAWDAEAPVMPDAEGNYPIPVPGVYKPYEGAGGKRR